MKKIKVKSGKILSVPTSREELIVVEAPSFVTEAWVRPYVEHLARSQVRLLWNGLIGFGYAVKMSRRPEVDDLISPVTQFLSAVDAVVILNAMLGDKVFKRPERALFVGRIMDESRRLFMNDPSIRGLSDAIEQLMKMGEVDPAMSMGFIGISSGGALPLDVLSVFSTCDDATGKAVAPIVEYIGRYSDVGDEIRLGLGSDAEPSPVAVKETSDETADDVRTTALSRIEELRTILSSSDGMVDTEAFEATALQLVDDVRRLRYLEERDVEFETACRMEARLQPVLDILDAATARISGYEGGLAEEIAGLRGVVCDTSGDVKDCFIDIARSIEETAANLAIAIEEASALEGDAPSILPRDKGAHYQKIAAAYNLRTAYDADLKEKIAELRAAVLLVGDGASGGAPVASVEVPEVALLLGSAVAIPEFDADPIVDLSIDFEKVPPTVDGTEEEAEACIGIEIGKGNETDSGARPPVIVDEALEATGLLLEKGWPGLGAFVLEAAVGLYPEGMLDISPHAFELAAMGWLGTRFKDDVEDAVLDLADRILEDNPDPEWAEGSHSRGMLMALFAGILLPVFRFQDVKLQRVIEGCLANRFGSAGPLHVLCDTLIEVIQFNAVIGLEALAGGGIETSWQETMDAYRNRAGNWLEDDSVHRGFSYQPAQEIWARLASTSAASIDAALKGVANDSANAVALIADAVADLDDPDILIEGVSRKKIVSHARRHLVENLSATREFLLRVRRHIENNPVSVMDTLTLKVSRIIGALNGRVRDALDYVADMTGETPFEEGARCVLIDVLQFLVRVAEDGVRDLPTASFKNLLACEFAIVDQLSYVGNRRPLSEEHDVLLRSALGVAKTIGTSRDEVFLDAFRRRLEQKAILAAHLILGAINDRTALEVDLANARELAVAGLGDRLNAVTNRVDMMAAMNFIDDGARRLLEDRLYLCHPDRITGMQGSASSLIDVDRTAVVDFPQASTIIDEIDAILDKGVERAETEIEVQIENLIRSGVGNLVDIDRIRNLVRQKDIMTAREYVALLEKGETLPAVLWRNEPLHDFADRFLPAVAEMYDDDGDTLLNDLFDALTDGSKKPPAASLIPAEMNDRSRREAAEIIRSWLDASPINRDLAPSLEKVLGFGLGLDVVKTKPISGSAANSDRHATIDIETEVVSLSGSFVPPIYGSDAGGKYRIVILGKKPTENTIVQQLSQMQNQQCGIVLARCLLKPANRSSMARDCRRKMYSGLVVDAAMVAFLSLSSGNRLANFINVAAPYAATIPYADLGQIPEEMFYGREAQRQDIVNMRGGSLVYGGRRLGKTALFYNTKSRYDAPEAGRHVVILTIDTVDEGTPDEVFWRILSDEFKMRGIIKRANSKPDTVIKEIIDFLESDRNRTILLLLDEADKFIASESEEKVDYRNIRHLTRLMERTERRFRFVMAGLHNSQRTAKTPNNPLARLGSPIFIGPFTGSDCSAGLGLICAPLSALGYEFEDETLAFRILSQSNYYPVLIHIYCLELLKLLYCERDESGPPYTIRKKHLDLVSEQKGFHEQVSNRFRLTIDLDPRYSLIALVMAMARYEQIQGGEQPGPVSITEIRDRCVVFGPENVFDDLHVHIFRALVDEMVGLGILQHVSGGYVLRSANVAVMIGSEEEVIDRLQNFVATMLPRDRSSDRRSINPDDPYRRSPLTHAQEYTLFYDEAAPISVLFGNGFAGLDMVKDLVEARMPSGCQIRVLDKPTMVNGSQLVKTVINWLGRLKAGERIQFIVYPEAAWNVRWLRAISDIAHKLCGSGVRVLFLGDAFLARSVADEGGVPDEIAIESVVPWSRQTLSAFLGSVGQSSLGTTDAADEILKFSGGFGPRVVEIIQGMGSGRRNVREVLEASLVTAGTSVEVMRQFGLTDADLEFLRGLSSILPVGSEDMDEVYDLVDRPIGRTSLDFVQFCEWSGIISMNVSGQYEINPLLRRCLEADRG